ncbi:MAG: hypothetical protein HKK66_13390 [Chlorobiaceae bacterium]|nr:hypothetical protein [Chlorobiaceae bacterium]
MAGLLADTRHMTGILDSHALGDIIEDLVDVDFAEFHDENSVFFFETTKKEKNCPKQ